MLWTPAVTSVLTAPPGKSLPYQHHAQDWENKRANTVSGGWTCAPATRPVLTQENWWLFLNVLCAVVSSLGEMWNILTYCDSSCAKKIPPVEKKKIWKYLTSMFGTCLKKRPETIPMKWKGKGIAETQGLNQYLLFVVCTFEQRSLLFHHPLWWDWVLIETANNPAPIFLSYTHIFLIYEVCV